MSNTNANFPASKPDWMPMEWYAFFIALFNRTGGSGSPIDINSLQKQDEISQDVPPQNAATMAALQGVNDLWAEQCLLYNTSDIRVRLADLESTLISGVDLGAIQQKMNDLEAMLVDFRIPTTPIPEQWTAPALINSWVAYDAMNWSNPGYFKDVSGVVHLRGMLKSGTIGSAMFVLPSGYRPEKVSAFAAVSNAAFGYATVDGSGNVVPASGSNTWFSIDGITFRAA